MAIASVTVHVQDLPRVQKVLELAGQQTQIVIRMSELLTADNIGSQKWKLEVEEEIQKASDLLSKLAELAKEGNE